MSHREKKSAEFQKCIAKLFCRVSFSCFLSNKMNSHVCILKDKSLPQIYPLSDGSGFFLFALFFASSPSLFPSKSSGSHSNGEIFAHMTAWSPYWQSHSDFGKKNAGQWAGKIGHPPPTPPSPRNKEQQKVEKQQRKWVGQKNLVKLLRSQWRRWTYFIGLGSTSGMIITSWSCRFVFLTQSKIIILSSANKQYNVSLIYPSIHTMPHLPIILVLGNKKNGMRNFLWKWNPEVIGSTITSFILITCYELH